MRKFDLNIERILEDWEVHHAVREVMANAIDEQLLTNTTNIEIRKDKKSWIIRDFGRGLKYEHLTQSENHEKLSRPDLVIGKFGVGLKDALATFDRHHIKVFIKSKFGDISLGQSSKHGFDDVVTLHAIINEPSEPKIIGTEFVLGEVKDEDIETAKQFFLKFSDETVLEKTQYGDVLKRGRHNARIYINGLRVAEEENFLFSYNITSITKVMRKALNRERSNVGRTAYTGRVKDILLECNKREVAECLVADLKRFEIGDIHDELTWIDVAVHACKLLNATGKVIFVTSLELDIAKDMMDRAKRDGFKIITIPQNVKEKIRGLKDIQGNRIRDLAEYTDQWNKSFEFNFLDADQLTSAETAVYSLTDSILKLIGGRPRDVEEILISETMRLEEEGYHDAAGVWEKENGRIVIKRTQLRSIEAYAGTLLHEVAHARSGASDVSREFEEELTRLLGTAAKAGLRLT